MNNGRANASSATAGSHRRQWASVSTDAFIRSFCLSENRDCRLGKEIYERDIRSEVEDGHRGEVVAIDVDTGNWGIDNNVISATDRLREKRPGAVNVLSERVGYPTLRHFGGVPRGEPSD